MIYEYHLMANLFLGVHNYIQGINLKVNVIARLEFELAYYDFVG